MRVAGGRGAWCSRGARGSKRRDRQGAVRHGVWDWDVVVCGYVWVYVHANAPHYMLPHDRGRDWG
jgi:hypothetical protein